METGTGQGGDVRLGGGPEPPAAPSPGEAARPPPGADAETAELTREPPDGRAAQPPSATSVETARLIDPT